LTHPKPQDAEWWADDRIATELTPPAPPSGTRGSFILPVWSWICVLATPVAAATLPRGSPSFNWACEFGKFDCCDAIWIFFKLIYARFLLNLKIKNPLDIQRDRGR